ncbi:TonB-dependent siderophore receptor [Luteolibacter pohnpeiensis]|uniref:TonB-dependent siderophore receptor n=1 Tax=Luteolibacter pohnpeiensis TaxID=454153 RepID=A0A934VW88_9BACT|nr:TonB-dependent siderophore receptor [Luteolibacter pohnpeiensis]MBK1882244.1 TonB-dependent siderophore receptor [Luteolibacter pohnpeiensis]
MRSPHSSRPAKWILPVALAAGLQASHAEEAVDLAPLTVTADANKSSTEKTEGYAPPASTTGALKSDVPLLETPQAISVLDRDLMEDQDARKLEDLLKNVSGVSTGGYYKGWDYFRIRGFEAGSSTFWDGLRGDYGRSVELYGLERVEVIKGPASSLYGQGPLGGMVNVVSKKPKAETFGELSLTGGSWNYMEVAGDTGTTFNESKTLYGRIVGLYSTQDSFVDYAETERYYIAPSLTWEISPDTKITFLASHQHDEGVHAFPLPAYGSVLYNPNGKISTDLFIGAPDIANLFEWERSRVGYQLEHKFNEVVSLRQNLSYSHLKQKWDNMLYPASFDGTTLYTYPYQYDESMDRFGVDTALDFDFDTGSINHLATVGVDYYREESDNHSEQIDYSDFPGSYVPIDVYDPTYPDTIPGYSTFTHTQSKNDSLGFYFQDHAKLTDQLTLTLGGRYDQVYYDGGSDEQKKHAFTPKAGITYALQPNVAVYANYSRSFEPQWYSTDSNGNAVDPEEGENWETGIKYSLFDGKLNGMATVFQLTRKNVATDNPATADPYDSIVSGEQRSRGFEWENSAQITPGLKFTMAYTYIDAEVTEDNTIAEGTRLIGVPDQSINAWLKYTIQDGTFEGLGFGFGGRYYTSQAGDQSDSFSLPAYGLLDAALYYEKENYRVQVNFNNLTDKRHFVGSYNDLYVLPGEPFNVSANVTWRF